MGNHIFQFKCPEKSELLRLTGSELSGSKFYLHFLGEKWPQTFLKRILLAVFFLRFYLKSNQREQLNQLSHPGIPGLSSLDQPSVPTPNHFPARRSDNLPLYWLGVLLEIFTLHLRSTICIQWFLLGFQKLGVHTQYTAISNIMIRSIARKPRGSGLPLCYSQWSGTWESKVIPHYNCSQPGGGTKEQGP